MEIQLVAGFDPNPLKLLWLATGVFALSFMVRNWAGARAERQWARDNTQSQQLLLRRENVANTNIGLHGLLALVALFSTVAGVGSVMSPRVAGPTQTSIGLVVVTGCLVVMNLLIAAVGWYYRNSRERAARDAMLVAAQVHDATAAQVGRERPILFPAGEPAPAPAAAQPTTSQSGCIEVSGGSATVELKVDVEVTKPKAADG